MRKLWHFYPLMFTVFPILLIDGLCLGVQSSEITHLIPKSVPKDLLDKYAGICTISLGLGSTLGGILTGKITDKWGTKISGRLGLLGFLVGCIVCIITLYVKEYAMAVLAAFIWGLFLIYI